ncbi:Cupin domain-containing protein [Cronobacter condimenti 1330]|uniref:Cupin n=1 Tax=Cronobacter condimenti 1330 TaxID=1073999 RepID=K8ADN5_9ENTR|nr:cupin domain-containing protein [Cronobacter condimenti]ALB63153.1 cupin [Cronobacter condimenti 1330]CCJ73899.1 Cupin domain-containing protein [Cronobacter condimenti 1330]
MTLSCETLYLRESCGGVPNNTLPVLLYRQVLPGEADDAAVWFEQRFGEHDWPARWRYPVFTYTHFHSNTHEVLGIYEGHAQIQLGGEEGPVVTLHTGDAVLIPAGVGHKQIDASADFMAVGAYPDGYSPDKFLDEPAQLAQTRANVIRVATPTRDPLFGTDSGLVTHW